MSQRRRKRRDSPMPATGAGLIRFYSEADSPGIKLKPYHAIIGGILLVIIVVLAHLFIKL